MTAAEVMQELKALGSESIKKVLRNHGVQEPFFGVRIGDMKPIQKRVKKDYELALALYDTGNYDAMYLAGLIADDAKMTKANLNRWVQRSQRVLCGSTVPWVAAESRFGRELALAWIESKKEHIAAAGWFTLSSLVAIKDDAELDLAELKRLLDRVGNTIHDQPNDVRYAMNGFVIAIGGYVKSLTEAALKTAAKIGRVSCDMGNTSCEVPEAAAYIRKIEARGALGKKRKSAKC
jgi:3-methyladenine DNA glycosylase AlkD